MILSDKVYSVLKWIDLVFFPAVLTLYSVLAGIWGWPYAQAIVGTGVAIETFIGALIGISAHNINKVEALSEPYIPKYGDGQDKK